MVVVALHRVVAVGDGPGDTVVGNGADAAARGQSAVSDSSTFRRDHAMVLAGGGAARHDAGTPFRAPERDRGAVGHRIGGHPGHLPGRAAGLAGLTQLGDAGARPAGDDAALVGVVLLRPATAVPPGAGVPDAAGTPCATYTRWGR